MLRGEMTRASRIPAASFAAGLLALGAAAMFPNATGRDPLGAEIERWSAFVRDNRETHPLWTQVKQVTEPALGRARAALTAGRRFLALQQLGAARTNLAAFAYLGGLPASQRKEQSRLEAEWARDGNALQAELTTTTPSEFAGVQPAAIRAIAEAALPQVRAFYDASLEYGHSTDAEAGLFYVGAARSQRDFASFCRSLSTSSSLRAPSLRPLVAELDELEGRLLDAYRPPAAIDRHSEFIAASSVLKEARELDAAGLRFGALLRYLLAAQRIAQLRPDAPALDRAAFGGRLAEMRGRLGGEVDHTIGVLFLETAEAEATAAAANPSSPTAAAVIVADVLPRYFAALERGVAEPPGAAPLVTVTLIRWPYT